MSPKENSASNGNRLLASLGPSDADLVRPDLEPRELKINQPIEEPNRPIRHVCFPDAGILSVVASISGDRDIEIGIIGREGVSGGAVALGNDRSPHKTYVQVAGTGHRITAEKFRRALNTSETFRMLMMKSVAAFNVQTAHTAVANARAHLEERLARWLLMAHDRIDGDEVALTHEFLVLDAGRAAIRCHNRPAGVCPQRSHKDRAWRDHDIGSGGARGNCEQLLRRSRKRTAAAHGRGTSTAVVVKHHHVLALRALVCACAGAGAKPGDHADKAHRPLACPAARYLWRIGRNLMHRVHPLMRTLRNRLAAPRFRR